MEAGETVSKLADEVGISRQRLYEWRDHLRLHGNLKSRRRGRPARSTAELTGPASGRARSTCRHLRKRR
ncbi:helix-turn-helix domain-containing protein [Mesorhizobium sp. M1076]|uniref:helix-turn-helix domain-containing protein n=1 Tax=Mesorhizobium sp. M1076 TaxID=2957054 RepID=UPI003336F26C